MCAIEKLKLLIWKNFLLQKRHKYQTLFEIASPVLFSLLIIFIRGLDDPNSKPETKYRPTYAPFYNDNETMKGNLGSIIKEGTLAFSPEGALTRRTLKDVFELTSVTSDGFWLMGPLFGHRMLPEPKGYKNAKEMEAALLKPNAMNSVLCGVQFDDEMANSNKWPDDVVFTIRFPATMRTPMVDNPIRLSWRTNLLFPLFAKAVSRDPDDQDGGKTPGYAREAFLGVQHAVSHAIMKQKLGKKVPECYLALQRFPQLAYRDDKLLVVLEKFISMIIMLCFAYTFVNTVRVVTAEKELQLKETMTIMGLPSWLHWLAWFMKQFSFLTISVILIVALFKIPFQSTDSGDRYSVLTFTPCSVLFFFLILFIMASLSFSFMVSVFFTRANTAAAFMGLAWIASYSVFMLTQVVYEDVSLSVKVLLSLISNTAMGFAFQMIIICEGTTRGLQWSDFFSPLSYYDNFVPGHVVLMLILDTILYMLIAMYVEKIRPGLYGVPMPWYFPFTKSYWMPRNIKFAEYKGATQKVVHDEEPQGVPVRVDIQNLTKIYKGNKKVVDNLNLRMYENEITVLLGHNGAGKTTTISMLAGTVPPTSGSAIIDGYNIVTETHKARKSLGFCPRHNVLFPDLTVAEHLIFYSKLKGVTPRNLSAEVEHFVKLLELEDKRDVESSNLSGGQKRRLSVGAAMCGSSRVVLLDQPTSGLDPAERRVLWDLLLKEKRGRTMILTTHFMDEADVLGDRIAIMAGGDLQCVGTPYFLKKHYGIGYKLTIVKLLDCVVNDVTSFLTYYVPNLKENSNIGSELTYILPRVNVSKFPNMLKELEEKKESLQISSYGLSVTTLEEVFMKAGAENDGDAERALTTNKSSDHVVIPTQNNVSAPIEKEKGFKLFTNHVKAMFLKLAYNSIRNKLSAFIQFVSPIFTVIISVVIARSWNLSMSSLPPLTLSLESGFKKTQALIVQPNAIIPGTVAAAIMMGYKDFYKQSKYPGMTYKDLGKMDLGKMFLELSKRNPLGVQYENVIGVTFGQHRMIGWFSNYGYHDSAISLAHLNDAFSRALLPGSSLKVINHPLPYSIEDLLRGHIATVGTMGFQFAFIMGFCMAFVSSFTVLFVIKERISGAKLLQRVAGVRPVVMWVCALVWDWTWLFLVYLCVIATLACLQEITLSTPEELGRVMMVLMVFSLAIIPLHYLASLCFEASGTGFSKMCFINIFTGCMPFLVTEVLRLPEVGSPFYAKMFDWLFSVMPIYCLSRSLRDMSVSSSGILACDAVCLQFPNIKCSRETLCVDLNITVCCIQDDTYMKWSEPGIGRYLFMMTMVGVISFMTLLVVEYRVLDKRMFYHLHPLPPLPDGPEDGDVRLERETLQAAPTAAHGRADPGLENSGARSGAAQNANSLFCSDLIKLPGLDDRGAWSEAVQTAPSLVCRDLTKYYVRLLAVNRLCFAVRRGECFGLLGINGAGKTSIFRMLTGDEPLSCGDAFVLGHSVRGSLKRVYRLIGYCPQFDALLDNLTARENLRIFSLLRGISAGVGAARAADLADTLGFAEHLDKKVSQCSEGTKRKISTAVALMGDPSLVFLDEPTTGMDPASKRLVWASISEAVADGRSVVLTSHSMEECEALCSRLTIMMQGRLLCLGSPQHLKSKFSQGYTLMVKCKAGPQRRADVAKVSEYITEHFNEVKVKESYLGINTYYISDAELPWWKVFQTMEEMRSSLPFEDYSVTQTSLEQVFLRITRLHKKHSEP